MESRSVGIKDVGISAWLEIPSQEGCISSHQQWLGECLSCTQLHQDHYCLLILVNGELRNQAFWWSLGLQRVVSRGCFLIQSSSETLLSALNCFGSRHAIIKQLQSLSFFSHNMSPPQRQRICSLCFVYPPTYLQTMGAWEAFWQKKKKKQNFYELFITFKQVDPLLMDCFCKPDMF